MYYKYRSLANIHFTLDILVNRRLYASEFTKLNDPMEGLFTYNQGTIPQWVVDAISTQKLTYRILSLCEQPDNLLMWSYYADAHKGIVLGVEIVDKNIKAESMRYVDDFTIAPDNLNQEEIAKVILSKKHILWKHEREHRIFTKGIQFVDVKIKELIFGYDTDPDTKKIIGQIAEQFNPGVIVSSITKQQLNNGSMRKLI